MTYDPDKLAHSFSSINMYDICPRKYFFQKVVKSHVDKGGPASVEGERVHTAMELRIRDKKPLVGKDANYERICIAIEAIAHGGKVMLEQKLCINKNLEPVSWYHETAWLRSILDVLVVKGDEAYIVDWKTGKRKPNFNQLEMSALQVWQHYPEVKTIRTAFVWLKDMDMDSENYIPKHKGFLWDKMHKRVQPIYDSLKNNSWPAKPSGLCNYCPAQDDCPEARR